MALAELMTSPSPAAIPSLTGTRPIIFAVPARQTSWHPRRESISNRRPRAAPEPAAHLRRIRPARRATLMAGGGGGAFGPAAPPAARAEAGPLGSWVELLADFRFAAAVLEAPPSAGPLRRGWGGAAARFKFRPRDAHPRRHASRRRRRWQRRPDGSGSNGGGAGGQWWRHSSRSGAVAHSTTARNHRHGGAGGGGREATQNNALPGADARALIAAPAAGAASVGVEAPAVTARPGPMPRGWRRGRQHWRRRRAAGSAHSPLRENSGTISGTALFSGATTKSPLCPRGPLAGALEVHRVGSGVKFQATPGRRRRRRLRAGRCRTSRALADVELPAARSSQNCGEAWSVISSATSAPGRKRTSARCRARRLKDVRGREKQPRLRSISP